MSDDTRSPKERHLDRVLSPNKRATDLPGTVEENPGSKRTRAVKRAANRRRNEQAKRSRKGNR